MSVHNGVGWKLTRKSKINQSKCWQNESLCVFADEVPPSSSTTNQQKFEFHNFYISIFVINIRHAEMTICSNTKLKKHIFDKILPQKVARFQIQGRGRPKNERKENRRNVFRKIVSTQQNQE